MNATLIELQFERYPLRDDEWIRYKVYGDSIFPWQECVQSRYYGDNVSARENLENRALSSCRESIEWHYGELGRLFPFIQYKNKNQLLKCPVKEVFITAMIMRNCLVCFSAFCLSKKTSLSKRS